MMRLYREGGKVQQVLTYLFGVTNGKGGKGIVFSKCWPIFPGIYGQLTMTYEGAKRNVRTYCKRSRHLSVFGQYRKNALMPKGPRHHLVNCSPEGMLELNGSMGQYFSGYSTVSQRSWRKGEKKKDTG